MNILIKLMSIVSLVIAPHLHQEVDTSPRIQKELKIKASIEQPVKVNKIDNMVLKEHYLNITITHRGVASRTKNIYWGMITQKGEGGTLYRQKMCQHLF